MKITSPNGWYQHPGDEWVIAGCAPVPGFFMVNYTHHEFFLTIYYETQFGREVFRVLNTIPTPPAAQPVGYWVNLWRALWGQSYTTA